MKKVLKIFIFLCAVFTVAVSYSQDINFSQFYELPLLRNPALAGIFSGDVRVSAAYRNQWQSVTVPYSTMALGGEIKFPIGETDNFITAGLQVTNDVAGDSKLSKLQLFPVINYHKAVGENSYLSAGIMAGAVQQRFDPSKLQFDDQFVNGTYSPMNPTRQTFSSTNVIYLDAAAGLCFSTVLKNDVKFYLGAGIFHFTQPRVAFLTANDVRLNHKWVINAGLSKPLSDVNRLTLYGDLFMQGGNRQGQAGVLLRHDLLQYDEDQNMGITVGGFYRWKDAIIPVIKFDYFKLAIGISYDINVSKLTVASQMRGGTEITLSYTDFFASRNSSLYKQRCPVF